MVEWIQHPFLKWLQVSAEGFVRYRQDKPRDWYIGRGIGMSKGRYRIVKNKKMFHIHRLVLEAFEGLRDSLHHAHHDNEDPADNRIENLKWLTRSEHISLHRRRELDLA